MEGEPGPWVWFSSTVLTPSKDAPFKVLALLSPPLTRIKDLFPECQMGTQRPHAAAPARSAQEPEKLNRPGIRLRLWLTSTPDQHGHPHSPPSPGLGPLKAASSTGGFGRGCHSEFGFRALELQAVGLSSLPADLGGLPRGGGGHAGPRFAVVALKAREQRKGIGRGGSGFSGRICCRGKSAGLCSQGT